MVESQKMQYCLLAEKDKTYNKGLEIALAMEAAAKDTKDLLAALQTHPWQDYITLVKCNIYRYTDISI